MSKLKLRKGQNASVRNQTERVGDTLLGKPFLTTVNLAHNLIGNFKEICILERVGYVGFALRRHAIAVERNAARGVGRPKFRIG